MICIHCGAAKRARVRNGREKWDYEEKASNSAANLSFSNTAERAFSSGLGS
jgi:hypothetical protein